MKTGNLERLEALLRSGDFHPDAVWNSYRWKDKLDTTDPGEDRTWANLVKWTALGLAIEGRRADVVALLIQFRASPNIVCWDAVHIGSTFAQPLGLSNSKGSFEISMFLLNAGADVRCKRCYSYEGIEYSSIGSLFTFCSISKISVDMPGLIADMIELLNKILDLGASVTEVCCSRKFITSLSSACSAAPLGLALHAGAPPEMIATLLSRGAPTEERFVVDGFKKKTLEKFMKDRLDVQKIWSAAQILVQEKDRCRGDNSRETFCDTPNDMTILRAPTYDAANLLRPVYSEKANTLCRVDALFDYAAQSSDELSFKKGDAISVTKRDGNWWTGVLNGRSGVFPINYVCEAETGALFKVTDLNANDNNNNTQLEIESQGGERNTMLLGLVPVNARRAPSLKAPKKGNVLPRKAFKKPQVLKKIDAQKQINVEREAEEVFSSYDLDRSGFIEVGEFVKCWTELVRIKDYFAGQEQSEQVLQKVFEAESNGSGGRLSKPQFVAFFCRAYHMQLAKIVEAVIPFSPTESPNSSAANSSAEKAFRAVDSNKNGTISENEFVEGWIKLVMLENQFEGQEVTKAVLQSVFKTLAQGKLELSKDKFVEFFCLAFDYTLKNAIKAILKQEHGERLIPRSLLPKKTINSSNVPPKKV